jgi:hypothetical protein
MFIDDFVWLTEIAEKLAIKHRVSQDEVEEVFFNSPKYRFVESGLRSGEDAYSAGGADGQWPILDRILHPQARQHGADIKRAGYG